MDRRERIERVRAGETWDLIVIGGGATGLGTAVDAASRGYRTLLLDAYDFAKGTSSRSTKLVHGGVRYLARGDIAMVREALRERGLLRLEDAVRKMTSLSAAKAGLTDRGLLRAGQFADITVFDPKHVADQATYTEPFQYNVGIEYGRRALQAGTITAAQFVDLNEKPVQAGDVALSLAGVQLAATQTDDAGKFEFDGVGEFAVGKRDAPGGAEGATQ